MNLEEKYERIRNLGREGFSSHYWVRNKNDKEGIVLYNGEIIIPVTYEAILDIQDGRIIVKHKNKFGIIGIQHNQIIPIEFDGIPIRFEDGSFKAEKNKKYGLISANGKELIPFIYDSLTGFEEGIMWAKKGEYWGAVNRYNHMVIPFEYLEVTEDKEKTVFFGVSKYVTIKKYFWRPAEHVKKFGIINKYNDLIAPFEYDEVKPISNGMASVNKKGLWFVIRVNNP